MLRNSPPHPGAHSIPRTLELSSHDGGLKMVQEPVEELQSLRGAQQSLTDLTVSNETRSLEDWNIQGKSLEMKVTFTPGDAETVGLNLRTGNGEKTVLRYDVSDETLALDRTQSGQVDFHEAFPGVHIAPWPLDNGKVELHVFIDWSSVEVFAHDGVVAISDKIFPQPDSEGIEVFVEGGSATFDRIEAWPLKSIW